ncbi:hypothetical protein ABT288_39750 [Streptomyces sp. NPDC001093]|uniref:hypothetical protein n=1 Tax=Streptomyces sp. NPDC001093 TaxID=3154376 RepID=UPI00332D5059
MREEGGAVRVTREEVRVVLVDHSDVIRLELGPGPRPRIGGAIDEPKRDRRTEDGTLGRTAR